MEKDESIECVRLLLEAGANPNISAGDKYQHYVRKTLLYGGVVACGHGVCSRDYDKR